MINSLQKYILFNKIEKINSTLTTLKKYIIFRRIRIQTFKI